MKKGKKIWDIWRLLGRVMNAPSNADKIIQDFFRGDVWKDSLLQKEAV